MQNVNQQFLQLHHDQFGILNAPDSTPLNYIPSIYSTLPNPTVQICIGPGPAARTGFKLLSNGVQVGADIVFGAPTALWGAEFVSDIIARTGLSTARTLVATLTTSRAPSSAVVSDAGGLPGDSARRGCGTGQRPEQCCPSRSARPRFSDMPLQTVQRSPRRYDHLERQQLDDLPEHHLSGLQRLRQTGGQVDFLRHKPRRFRSSM